MIKNFIKNLSDVLSVSLEKTFTKKYNKNQFEKKIMRHEIDLAKCRKCRLCQKVCPNNAISFEDGPKIDYKKCSFCGLCTLYCPTNALVIKNSAMAELNKN